MTDKFIDPNRVTPTSRYHVTGVQPPAPDFTVSPHGSITLVRPRNSGPREWLEEHVSDDAQWFGGALVVEHRFVADLLAGIREAGFTVRGA